MYCELLNEQISAERYRTAGAGCGRGDHTPFVRDVALLSFRHSFVLNVHVRIHEGCDSTVCCRLVGERSGELVCEKASSCWMHRCATVLSFLNTTF